jgi:hypothetical protein
VVLNREGLTPNLTKSLPSGRVDGVKHWLVAKPKLNTSPPSGRHNGVTGWVPPPAGRDLPIQTLFFWEPETRFWWWQPCLPHHSFITAQIYF